MKTLPKTKAVLARKEREATAPDPQRTVESILYMLGSNLHFAEKALDAWQQRFASDPSYALQWSDETFKTAATRKVVLEAIAVIWRHVEEYDARAAEFGMVQAGVAATPVLAALGEVETRAHEMVLRGAKYPCRSTSTASRETALCETAAWAELHEQVRGYIGHLAADLGLDRVLGS